MKSVISAAAIALALVLSVVPAIADDTFQAFSKMPVGEQEILTPLSDGQLAVIEGEGWGDFCKFCSNYAAIYQANVNTSAFSKVRQRNVAVVNQEIN